jgi:hypothetical protein
MRKLVADDLPAFAELLNVPIDDDQFEIISESFAAETLYTDLLARVGANRLLHVEYVRSPTRDVPARITGYRAQIMRRHPGKSITQFAIVLGEGRLQSCDDPPNGFKLGLKTLYVRDCDPQFLLANPHRAPLAVLAQGSTDKRIENLRTVMKMTRKEPDGAFLAEAALTLATITLDRSTIARVMEELGMTVEDIAEFYSETTFGRAIHDHGREQGREEASVLALGALLRDRFGEHAQIQVLAERLAKSPDLDAVIHTINQAHSIDDLLDQAPPEL